MYMGCTKAAEAATNTERDAYHDPAGRRTEAPQTGRGHSTHPQFTHVPSLHRRSVLRAYGTVFRSTVRLGAAVAPGTLPPSLTSRQQPSSFTRACALPSAIASPPHRKQSHVPSTGCLFLSSTPPSSTNKHVTNSDDNQNAPIAKQRRVGRVMPNRLCVQRHRLLILPRREVLVPIGTARLGVQVALRLLPARRRCRRRRRGGRVHGCRGRGGRRRTGRRADRRRRHHHHRRCGNGRHRRRNMKIAPRMGDAAELFDCRRHARIFCQLAASRREWPPRGRRVVQRRSNAALGNCHCDEGGQWLKRRYGKGSNSSTPRPRPEAGATRRSPTLSLPKIPMPPPPHPRHTRQAVRR